MPEMKSKAIVSAINELSGTEVSLDSHNKGGGNYKYASLPHLQRVVMPTVTKYGLLLTQTVVSWDIEFRTLKVSKSATAPPTDKLFCLAKCELMTTLQDPVTGEQVSCTVYGSKVDQSSGDKSLGALTTAKRYGIAALFNLILSDDDGGDTDATENHNPFDIKPKAGATTTPPTPPSVGTTPPAPPSSLSALLGL